MLVALSKSIGKGPTILIRRIRSHGVSNTLLWLYARSIPFVFGTPIIKYSEVTPQVFVGAQFRKSGKRKLERLGITNCVNLRIEFDDASHGLDLAGYCHLPTIDDDAPSIEHLEKGIRFIDDVVSRGEKVYIHCAGGVGRAPTMAAAYFISKGKSLDEAFAIIGRARPFINVMPAQIEQLQRFESISRARR